ncbi:MAG: hypothetical protein GY862_02755 [Gammaproteobacteria bacterium]|nr:hypothetical protein [Gammaproteobacteria bacterium]
MSNFDAQLGNPQAAGLLPARIRTSQIRRGENPYHAGDALPPNSPVFFGREEIHHNICARLLTRGKPQSVSLLDERRIGKSSLLNQVYQALAVEPNLLVLKTTAQGFSDGEQADFFGCLHAAMCQGLGGCVSDLGMVFFN